MSVASDLGGARSRAALKAKLLGCASVLALSIAVLPSEALAQASAVCGTFIAPNTIANPAVGNPTGKASVACGDDALAAGQGSIAIGGDTNNGGVSATANGIGSIAIGSDNITPTQGALANADFAVAVGDSSRALGLKSVAVGAQAQANGAGGVAVGNLSVVGTNSVAVGQLANANALDATALGANTLAGPGATAVGHRANATGLQSVAIGQDGGLNNPGIGALATGVQSTAIGTDAFANTNLATAVGAGATVQSLTAGQLGGTALGAGASVGATSTGNFDSPGSIAIGGGVDSTGDGFSAIATGPNATAVGNESVARGGGAVAIGAGAQTGNAGVGANFATAVGTRADASATFSSAIGSEAGAKATNPTVVNEMRFGVAAGEVANDAINPDASKGNTYTMGGITSPLSKSRQTGPLQIVTTDAAGHLASDGGALFKAIAKAQAGIAIALAIEAPSLTERENFGIRVGWGNFDGESNAFGFSAMGVLCRGCFGPGDRVAIDGGIGIGSSDFRSFDSGNVVAGRVGIQWSWK